MNYWRLPLLLASFLLLAGGIKSLLDYWQYDELAPDVAQLMLHQVTADEVRQNIREAIVADNPSDARMYLNLAQTFGYPISPVEFQADLARLESPLNTARRTVNDFTTGFVAGDAASGAGVAGAIASDFTVVGDVRDLWEQYQIHAKGGTINPLIVTLAGWGGFDGGNGGECGGDNASQRRGIHHQISRAFRAFDSEFPTAFVEAKLRCV